MLPGAGRRPAPRGRAPRAHDRVSRPRPAGCRRICPLPSGGGRLAQGLPFAVSGRVRAAAGEPRGGSALRRGLDPMPRLWIVHREPRTRAALARLAAAPHDALLGAPGDPALRAAPSRPRSCCWGSPRRSRPSSSSRTGWRRACAGRPGCCSAERAELAGRAAPVRRAGCRAARLSAGRRRAAPAPARARRAGSLPAAAPALAARRARRARRALFALVRRSRAARAAARARPPARATSPCWCAASPAPAAAASPATCMSLEAARAASSRRSRARPELSASRLARRDRRRCARRARGLGRRHLSARRRPPRARGAARAAGLDRARAPARPAARAPCCAGSRPRTTTRESDALDPALRQALGGFVLRIPPLRERVGEHPRPGGGGRRALLRRAWRAPAPLRRRRPARAQRVPVAREPARAGGRGRAVARRVGVRSAGRPRTSSSTARPSRRSTPSRSAPCSLESGRARAAGARASRSSRADQRARAGAARRRSLATPAAARVARARPAPERGAAAARARGGRAAAARRRARARAAQPPHRHPDLLGAARRALDGRRVPRALRGADGGGRAAHRGVARALSRGSRASARRRSRSVDVTALLGELLEARRERVRERRLLVLQELDTQRPEARGDPEQIRFALDALLGACFALVPERGDVYLASKHHATGLRGEPSLRVLVRFHGPQRGAPAGRVPGVSPVENSLALVLAELVVRAQQGSFTRERGPGRRDAGRARAAGLTGPARAWPAPPLHGSGAGSPAPPVLRSASPRCAPALAARLDRDAPLRLASW